MHGIDFIKDLAVVMLVAGLVGWACHRAGLSVVVGYLISPAASAGPTQGTKNALRGVRCNS